jgi:hypothetical protein
MLLRYNLGVKTIRLTEGFSSPIAITASFSMIMLTGAILYTMFAQSAPTHAAPTQAVASVAPSLENWQQELAKLGITADSLGIASSREPDAATLIGPIIAGQLISTYDAMVAQGDYSQEDLKAAAEKIAAYMKVPAVYEKVTIENLSTHPDTSRERTIAYRDELQRVIAPLNSIKSAEFEIYALYEQTGDVSYLNQLADAAELYRGVAQNAARMEVPQDAASYHRDIVNALSGFASVLQELSEHGADPMASVALLRTYNEQESEIFRSYNAMRSYYGNKAL